MSVKPRLILSATVPLGLIAWGGLRLARVGSGPPRSAQIPTSVVKRGDVTITVSARGDLQGGNAEMLSAPMTGGTEVVIPSLRRPGEQVNAGDTVVQFDTTEQDYKLKEAEADLA